MAGITIGVFVFDHNNNNNNNANVCGRARAQDIIRWILCIPIFLFLCVNVRI